MQPSPDFRDFARNHDQHRFSCAAESLSINQINGILTEQVNLIEMALEPLPDLRYVGFASGLRCEVLAEEPLIFICNSGYHSLALPKEIPWGARVDLLKIDSAAESADLREVLFDEQFETDFRAQAIEEITALIGSYADRVEDFCQSLQLDTDSARVMVRIEAGYMRVIRAV